MRNTVYMMHRMVALVVVMIFTTTTVVSADTLSSNTPNNACITSALQKGQISQGITASVNAEGSISGKFNDLFAALSLKDDPTLDAATVSAMKADPSSSNVLDEAPEITNAHQKDMGKQPRHFINDLAGLIRKFISFILVGIAMVESLFGKTAEAPVAVDRPGLKDMENVRIYEPRSRQLAIPVMRPEDFYYVENDVIFNKEGLGNNNNDGDDPITARMEAELAMSKVRGALYAAYAVGTRADRKALVDAGLVIVQPADKEGIQEPDKKSTYHLPVGQPQPHQLAMDQVRIPARFTESQWQDVQEWTIGQKGRALKAQIDKYFAKERGVGINITKDVITNARLLETMSGTMYLSYEKMLGKMAFIVPEKGMHVINKFGSDLEFTSFFPEHDQPGSLVGPATVTMNTGEVFEGFAVNLGWYTNEAEKNWRFTNALYSMLKTNEDLRTIIRQMGDVWALAVTSAENTSSVREWVNTWFKAVKNGRADYRGADFGKDVTRAFAMILSNSYNTQLKSTEFTMQVGGFYFVSLEIPQQMQEPDPDFMKIFEDGSFIIEQLDEATVEKTEIVIEEGAAAFLQNKNALLTPSKVEEFLREQGKLRQVSDPNDTPINSVLADSVTLNNVGDKSQQFKLKILNLTTFGDLVVVYNNNERTSQQTKIKGMLDRQDAGTNGTYRDILTSFNKNTVDFEDFYIGWRLPSAWEFGFLYTDIAEQAVKDAQFGRRIIDATRSRDFMTNLLLAEKYNRGYSAVVTKELRFADVRLSAGHFVKKEGSFLYVPMQGMMGYFVGNNLQNYDDQFTFADTTMRDSLMLEDQSRFGGEIRFQTKPLLLPLGFEIVGAGALSSNTGVPSRGLIGVQSDFKTNKLITLGADYVRDLNDNRRLQAWLGFNSANLYFGQLSDQPVYFMPLFRPVKSREGSLWAAVSYSDEYYKQLATSQGTRQGGLYAGYKWVSVFAQAGIRDYGAGLLRLGCGLVVPVGNSVVINGMVAASHQDPHGIPNIVLKEFSFNGGVGIAVVFGKKQPTTGRKYKVRMNTTNKLAIVEEIVPGSKAITDTIAAQVERGYTGEEAKVLTEEELKDGVTVFPVREDGYRANKFFDTWNKAALDIQVNLNSAHVAQGLVNREYVKYIAGLIVNEQRMPPMAADSIVGKTMVFTVKTGSGAVYTVIAAYASDGNILVDVTDPTVPLTNADIEAIAQRLWQESWKLEDAAQAAFPATTFSIDSIAGMPALEQALQADTTSLAKLLNHAKTDRVLLKFQTKDKIWFGVSIDRLPHAKIANVKVGTLDETRLHYDVAGVFKDFNDTLLKIDHKKVLNAINASMKQLKVEIGAATNKQPLVNLYNALDVLKRAGYTKRDSIDDNMYKMNIEGIRQVINDTLTIVSDSVRANLEVITSNLIADDQCAKILEDNINARVRTRWDVDLTRPLTFEFIDRNGRRIVVILQKDGDKIKATVNFGLPRAKDRAASTGLKGASANKTFGLTVGLLALLAKAMRKRYPDLDLPVDLGSAVPLVQSSYLGVRISPAIIPLMKLSRELGVEKAFVSALVDEIRQRLQEQEGYTRKSSVKMEKIFNDKKFFDDLLSFDISDKKYFQLVVQRLKDAQVDHGMTEYLSFIPAGGMKRARRVAQAVDAIIADRVKETKALQTVVIVAEHETLQQHEDLLRQYGTDVRGLLKALESKFGVKVPNTFAANWGHVENVVTIKASSERKLVNELSRLDLDVLLNIAPEQIIVMNHSKEKGGKRVLKNVFSDDVSDLNFTHVTVPFINSTETDVSAGILFICAA
jgi:hypothetical protein